MFYICANEMFLVVAMEPLSLGPIQTGGAGGVCQ
jgi:hypothetical protein